jgi:hypothetical protein
MNEAQLAGLCSATLGFLGTAILVVSSYSLEPFEGGVFGSDAIIEHNNRVRTKNKRRTNGFG